MSQNYLLMFVIPFNAADDAEAREVAIQRILTHGLQQERVKLQKLRPGKEPVGVRITRAKDAALS